VNGDWDLFAEQTLLRWCTAIGQVTEAQMIELSAVKRHLLVGFDPADTEVGCRWWAQRFREEAARITGAPPE